jgi:hypothetical protein
MMILLFMSGIANASYTVTHLNTTVILNKSTTAHVNEVLTVYVNNYSIKQYNTDRVALNLSLSQWQSLIGPMLVQHIINVNSGVQNFKFLPGPISPSSNGGYAKLYMSYDVENVTTYKRIAPKVINYVFNDKVFNFGNSLNGDYLYPNTTLNIIVPKGVSIVSIYPLPDSPTSGFSSDYKNVTEFSWFDQEPLSKFKFSYDVNENLQYEIGLFINSLYVHFAYVIYIIILLIIVIIVGFLLRRHNKK